MANDSLRSAWIEFVNTGKITSTKIKPVVQASWQRCVKAGVSPYKRNAGEVISAQAYQKLLKENEELINISVPIMDNLHQFVAGSGFLVTLAAANGIILKLVGNTEVINWVSTGTFVEGADWSESNAGTNAIGTPLVTGEPIQLFSYEHFCTFTQKSACSAAPIRNPQGKIIGILNMTGNDENVHSHTLGMVVAAANAIENFLVIKQSEKKLQLANQYKSTIIDSISEGLIAADSEGIITHYNRIALSIIGVSPRELTGRSVYEILPKQNERFFRVFSTGKYLTDEEMEILTIGGRKKFIISSRPIKNELTNVVGTVVIMTELKRTQKLAQRMAGASALITFDNLIGQNKQYLGTIEVAKMASSGDSNVLLLGESGTGKDAFAQAIHNESYRRNGPFVAINCSAIPRELIASELFGYTEGAFTGAKRGGSPGKFELAHGGTVFLDEIGEMPMELQATLLRVLEQRKFVRIGGHEVISADVRIIAATNRDLAERVSRGDFRQDLFYRLNVITIKMIPLRERPDDLPLLVENIYRDFAVKRGKSPQPIAEEFIKALSALSWPGNIRELQNVLERCVNLSKDATLDPKYLPEELKALDAAPSVNLNIAGTEKDFILKLMQTHNGNVTRVAKEMGIARTTLYRKLQKYGFEKSYSL